jgi:hypothetical protein
VELINPGGDLFDAISRPLSQSPKGARLRVGSQLASCEDTVTIRVDD